MTRTVAALALSLLVLASIAFWPLYLSRSWPAIDRYTHAHALLGTAWLLVLIVQPLLILRGYRAAHRITGRASLFVAGAFVVSGVLLAHFRVRGMSDATFAKEGIYLYLPLAVALLFAAACGLGFRWRRSAAVHSRFMASTALLLIDPVIARILFFHLPPLPSEILYQGITFTVIAVIMAFMARSLPASAPGRDGFRNYCVGAVATLALFFVVPHTIAWLAFVHWFRALPLT